MKNKKEPHPADRSVLAVRDCLMVRLDAVIRLYTRLLPQLH